jgi:hypothetical protein
LIKIYGIHAAAKSSFPSLTKGLKRHGDIFEMRNWYEADDGDGYCQTNLIKPKIMRNDERRAAYTYIRDSGKPYLVNESPSFRRYLGWARLGWYSYKWTEGLFGNENCPPDRWRKFEAATGIQFKDWNSPGDSILIMCQKEGDSSLLELYKTYDSFYDWLEVLIHQIRQYSDRPIIIRPHPRNRDKGIRLANKLQKKLNDKRITVSEDLPEIKEYLGDGTTSYADGLYRDLAQAYCVVTYNSLSAIEAICEGIPTFALNDGSMIWPVAHKDLSQIENLSYDTDLTQWKSDIAYTQWTGKEHSTGESWAHLKPLVFK